MSDSRTNVRARSTARSKLKTMALEGIIRTQGEILNRWMDIFGEYCTTAASGQLYQDTELVVDQFRQYKQIS